MDNSMIGKIQKAKRYAAEPERIAFHSLSVDFKGSNNEYVTTLGPDGWHCTCPGFQKYAICPHIMTLERILGVMLKRQRLPYANGQNVVSDVEKATQYSKEIDRLKFTSFEVTVHGEHGDHIVTYQDGEWECNNEYFRTHKICSHVMVMERLLSSMVTRMTMVKATD